MEISHNQIVSFIWSIADDVLRDVFLRGQYRDAISLLAHLVFEPVKDNLPKIISLYDPACGSGGMLTESREYLMDIMLEEVDKMKPLEFQPQGSRVASIHNGSSLFTGDAGSGESNIRRYLIENDLVDAIIQLPNNIFYNTGITTYVWLLTNKKADNRKGKVQLIDASQAFEKLRKNQGSRNCTITPEHRNAILKTYMDFVKKEADGDKVASKIFDGDDFRFYNVTIERPLRLKSQFNALKIDEMLYDNGEPELSKWLYQTYGEKVFEGLDAELPGTKEYLNDNEIKLTDKKLAKLISVKEWQGRRELMDAAKQLMHAIGTEVFMDFPPTKIGCEISFNKYFYKPAPLRTLEENERDILELDRQSQGFIQSLFNLM
ncbi:MAG: N-6 DNA methylase [Bacteroidales bacterium]|nr:N-6 DNA methylase [Bacteroidales bacterium]